MMLNGLGSWQTCFETFGITGWGFVLGRGFIRGLVLWKIVVRSSGRVASCG